MSWLPWGHAAFPPPSLPWVSVKVPNPNEHAALAHAVNACLFPPVHTLSL